ncbi:enhanced serine sensitivity protein SseB [uncultured Succinivibrio sp.]|jgi:hypothetical protein|uniref:enhanced serine sensitivity protein SseB n=1 Tax=uncultured Succinivibrio sp. TaxID=540749 RepID=UPI0025FC1D8E|nr:enhanced serine sensitivity protein SseB [uncultured Succinivibrio sp.]
MNIDVNKPVENPELSKLLNEYNRTDNEEKRNNLLDYIAQEFALNSHLLSVIKVDDNTIVEKNGQKYFKEDSKISFVQFTSDDNQVFFPAFTDWKELRKGDRFKNEYIKTLILSFDDYYAMVKDSGAGVVINPFSHNLVFSNGNLQYMKQRKDIVEKGHSEISVKEDTQVMLGEPKIYPDAMVKALTEHSKKVKEIKSIWLKLMIRNEEQSYLLVVDFAGDRKKIFSGLADAARDYLPSRMYIDIVPYNDDFGRKAAENSKPFYQRKHKLFGLFG